MSNELRKVKTGIIGCGNISGIYFQNLCHTFDVIDLVACADLDVSRARAKAEEKDEQGNLKHPGVRAMSVEELLADPEIEIVVNLTTPQGHFPVSMQALEAGKNVHAEKPITLTREEGQKLLAAAKSKNLLVGNAPDTFLGAGIQTCRKLIDDGWIGEPVSATAFMCCHGHESWHPGPGFYYLNGGGPMFDMGPYYLTALVNLIGPVKKVAGMTKMTFKERYCTAESTRGQILPVEIPTHIAGLMEFANGAVGTIITSFDVWGHHLPCIEIHGTEGSLVVPDPNCFGGEIMVKRGFNDWQAVPYTHAYADNSRGIGVADMAYAIQEKRANRCSGELAYHVLDLMHGFHDAAAAGKTVDIASTCPRPAPLPMTPRPGTLLG